MMILVHVFVMGLLSVAQPVTKTPVANETRPIEVIRPDENPFWKKRDKVYRKIVEERYIAVSVKDEPAEGEERKRGKNKILFVGAGLASVPLDKMFALSREFSHLIKVSSMVKEVRYNQQKQELFIHSAALGYHARMLMKVEIHKGIKIGSRQLDEISFVVIEGSFLGMTGVLRFEDYERRKTEISLTADYFYNKLPFPSFFIEFGFELILQKMAGLMRSYAEDFYKK